MRCIHSRLAGFALAALSPVSAATQDPPPVGEERGLVHVSPQASPGYTLFSPLMSGTTFLVDLAGEVVHRWETDLPPNMAYLLPNGNLLRGVRLESNPRFFGGGISGRIQEYTWDGELVWDWTLSDDGRCLHHDIEPMPNGNLLAILWEHVFPEDAVTMGRDPATVGEGGWWPDAVFEIEPVRPDGANIVWEWHAYDHLVQDFDADAAFFGVVPDEPGRIDVNADHRDDVPLTRAAIEEQRALEEEMAALGYIGGDGDEDELEPGEKSKGADWLHTNAVDYNAELDLIALSTPELNEVWILDHSTTTEEAAGDSGGRYGRGGDLLYRWGNPKNYGAGRGRDRRLFYQHDVQWIADGRPGAGHLLLFNNGRGRGDMDYSSVLELALPFDVEGGFARESGAAFGPAEPAWSYVALEPEEFFASFISGCERLPGGNTLVCAGPQGRLFEVSPSGEVVWDYRNPHGGEVLAAGKPEGSPPGRTPSVPPFAVFRALRYAPDYPAFTDREL